MECPLFTAVRLHNGPFFCDMVGSYQSSEVLWTYVTVHRDKFLTIKPPRCTNFSNLFWNETLHVSDSSSVHHQEFSTVHTAMVYVIQVFQTTREQDQDGTGCSSLFHPDPARVLSEKPVWHIPLLCVQWKTPDDGQRNCPRHVEFPSKINLRN